MFQYSLIDFALKKKKQLFQTPVNDVSKKFSNFGQGILFRLPYTSSLAPFFFCAKFAGRKIFL